MAIAKPPRRPLAEIKPASEDDAAEAFIRGAEQSPVIKDQSKPPAPVFTPIMVRFEGDMLSRIDRSARHKGLSRAAWIRMVVSSVLDKE